MALERWTNPKPLRRTCSPRYGRRSCRGESAKRRNGRVGDLPPEIRSPNVAIRDFFICRSSQPSGWLALGVELCAPLVFFRVDTEMRSVSNRTNPLFGREGGEGDRTVAVVHGVRVLAQDHRPRVVGVASPRVEGWHAPVPVIGQLDGIEFNSLFKSKLRPCLGVNFSSQLQHFSTF